MGHSATASSSSAVNEITLGNASVTKLRIPGLGSTDGHVLTYSSSAGAIVLAAAGGGGASDLNGLSDCKETTGTFGDSLYIGQAGSNVTSNSRNNTTVGLTAGTAITDAAGCTFMGTYAGYAITVGTFNTALGQGALQSEDDGSRNTAIGYEALYQLNYSGWGRNTAVGSQAGRALTSNSFQNTIIGAEAANSQGSSITNCTVIGYGANPSAFNSTNQITLGNTSVGTLRCQVQTITSLSDERDKTNIEPIPYGLDFIDSLKPKSFVWDNRPEIAIEQDEEGNDIEVEFYSANKGKEDIGFIAQDLLEVDDNFLNLVHTDNPDKLEASYGRLIPVLVQAIKELKAEVELLKNK